MSRDAEKNQQNSVCAQRRLRSAWAFAQIDQSLRWVLKGHRRRKVLNIGGEGLRLRILGAGGIGAKLFAGCKLIGLHF